MSDTIEFPVDLRALLAQRAELKARRIHKQWFCLDPEAQSEVDAALAELAELTGREVLKQQAQAKTSQKYSLPTPIRTAQERYDAAVARSREVGVMGVFQNLTDDQVKHAQAGEDSFMKAVRILTDSFLRWETADGQPIPDDVFGAADLDTLLQPEVLEQGEWLPLASKIITESTSVIDRPTSRTL